MAKAGEANAEALWVLPHEPTPVRLMNTIWADRHGVHDALRTPADLAGWLATTGQSAGPVTAAHVEAFRALRDALRRLAALLTDDPRPTAASPTRDVAQAIEAVNLAADAGPAGPRLRLHNARLERDDTPTGPTGALANVAGQAVTLLTGQSGSLNACHAPGCVLYYAKNHPRRGWCSTTCGNRARAARHYQRRVEGQRAAMTRQQTTAP